MKFIEHSTVAYSEDEKVDVTSIWIMEDNGIGFGRLYFFHDDKENAYMDNLSVSELHRKKGMGLLLQEHRERLAKKMGYKKIVLWVEKDTWQEEWYKRRGFKYFKDYKYNWIWLRRDL